MTPDEYRRAVRAASDELAAGVLDWHGHYVALIRLQRGYTAEHGSGWAGVVQAALRSEAAT